MTLDVSGVDPKFLTACGSGHPYDRRRRWCPTCGEPTPKPVKAVRKNHTSLLIWEVPLRLRARFKGACLGARRPMRDVLLEFMAKFARENGY